MRKNPNLINSIEVKYFRSINSQKIRDCKPVNIFTGGNDIGKSNLLRALNLFFNERNEHGDDIAFRDEFSHSRLDTVRRDSIKGKQFIQIEVEFNCQDSFQKTLPARFKVRKTWFRDSKTPNLSHNLDGYIASGALQTTKNKAEGSLQRFLNSVVFTYLPAIKDRSIFQSVLSELQTVLLQQSESTAGSFIHDVERFNTELEKQAQELRIAFEALTGVDARISLPSTYADLFRAFDIKTAGAFEDSVALDNRGDGVRVRFLPAILNYIAERSSKLHVWGIEEPENSMEYKRAFELSDTISKAYSKNAQIFLTTHSPAFIDLGRSGQSIYMASRNGPDTHFSHLNSTRPNRVTEADPYLMIADELGHVRLMDELHTKLQDRLAVAEKALANYTAIMDEIQQIKKPVLLTEGKTDVLILAEAWKRLRRTPPPFVIKSCNVLTDDDKNDAAGAAQLATCLKSIMADHPGMVIGLFDRDEEGQKCWALNANFVEDDSIPDIKAAKNSKAFAVLLPVPDGIPELEKSSHHCTEFMFPMSALATKINGKGLQIKPLPVIVQCGGKTLSKEDGTEPWQMMIAGGKKVFAEEIVPNLGDEAFKEFEKIFMIVENLIASEQKMPCHEVQSPTEAVGVFA
ncbi:ATP-dependent nuclease [Sinorhizobium meliloti]|uniref:ATP-dependent nuclease n=1 Tax=Rhizobium meliloti TaxID=382 RepID=UPI0013E29EE5|nr:ATP-binding protein [Sinorhizobium meliloti]